MKNCFYVGVSRCAHITLSTSINLIKISKENTSSVCFYTFAMLACTVYLRSYGYSTSMAIGFEMIIALIHLLSLSSKYQNMLGSSFDDS